MHRNRNLALAALTIALLAFALYYALAARAYFTPPPAPPTDPIATFNASLPQAPESDHAGPAYAALHDAWEAAKPELPDPLPYDFWDNLRPDHPDFERVAATIRTLEPRLEAARQAAARPVLGARLFPATPERQAERNQPPVNEAMAGSLFNALIPALSETSTTIRLLTIDAAHAASTNDPARFTADIHTILAAGRHMREVPLFISDILALRAVANTAELIARTLHERPSLLDATNLAALQADLTDTARNHAILRLDTEITGIADLFDRTFSPGPRGRITAAGIERLNPLVQYSDPNARLFRSIPDPRSPLAPLRAKLIAPRSTQLALYAKYIEEAKAAQSAGLRAIGDFQTTEHELMLREETSGRYAPVQTLIPAMASGLFTEQQTRLEAEAAIVALALHRHHADHNAFPQSLDQLVPTYLTHLPPDPYDPAANPIKYRLTDTGPTLYYIGANATNNNATPPTPDPLDPNAHLRMPSPTYTTPTNIHADWIVYPPTQRPR